MKTTLKVALGIVIAVVVLTAGCAALIGAGANEVAKESNKHAITHSQYRSIKAGLTRRQVERRLGEPADDQDMNVSVAELGVAQNTQCIYYNKRGDLLAMYQFCFDNGHLTSKSKY